MVTTLSDWLLSVANSAPSNPIGSTPSRITTYEDFCFNGSLIDPNGTPLESEMLPQPFADAVAGLKPNDNVFSDEKIPYFLAVYRAVPEWLGCTEADLRNAYGYTPDQLEDFYKEGNRLNPSKVFEILSDLETESLQLLKQDRTGIRDLDTQLSHAKSEEVPLSQVPVAFSKEL